jgi:alkylation response protein AidB-like acyl-CoA dehydrogenase
MHIATKDVSVTAPGFVAQAEALAEQFAERTAAHDRDGSFVAENYAALKAAGFFAAAVPLELGGGGADIAEVSEIIRTLAHGCSSTALAYAMHSHQVVIPAWRWHNQAPAKAAVEPLLKRIAAEGLILTSSGGGDWVGGSGRAEKVDGGWKVHAKKGFVSGSPVGDLLMTGVVSEEGVLHFALPLRAEGVRRINDWDTMGMRGTGSERVEIDGYFLADEKVALKRKAGEWHMIFYITGTLAIPLIYSAYVGVAERARDRAVGLAKARSGAARQPALAGDMETELRAAQMALAHMIRSAETMAPGPDSVNEVMIGRQLVERHAIKAVELAMELASGSGFYRAAGVEQAFRDIQAARYHPMRMDKAAVYAGTLATGGDVSRIF